MANKCGIRTTIKTVYVFLLAKGRYEDLISALGKYIIFRGFFKFYLISKFIQTLLQRDSVTMNKIKIKIFQIKIEIKERI